MALPDLPRPRGMSQGTAAIAEHTQEAALSRPPRNSAANRSPWRDAWSHLKHNRMAVLGLAFIVLIGLTALFADVVSPVPHTRQDSSRAYETPSAEHWMGTDQLGRDLFSRLLQGARISLSVGIVTQLIILIIGVPVGAVAGYFGGRVDQALMRMIDVMYSFPDLLIVIIVMASLRAAFRDPRAGGFVSLLASVDGAFGGLLGVFVALALVSWLTVARLVRGEVLALKEREFVQAARASGASRRSVILRHLVPNTVGVIVVAATFGIPRAIIVEASLSFIGLGVQAPMTSWGVMLLEGYKALRASPHLIVFPALALSLTVLAYNFLGDGLRDALDPWTRPERHAPTHQ